MSITVFLLVLVLSLLASICRVGGTIPITAFDKFGVQIFTTIKNVAPSSLGLTNSRYDSVQRLTVGNGTEIFEIWIPWDYGFFFDGRPFVLASALVDIVAQNPNLKGVVSIIPERFYLDEVEPLDRYFEQYTEETGMVLEDEFFKSTYYDYKIGDSWVAVPSGLSWNWDIYLEYATKLKNSGRPNGFQMLSNLDEETFTLMPTLGRLANVHLVNQNGTCGLRNQRWYDALEKYIRQPLRNGIADYILDRTRLSNDKAIVDFLRDRNPDTDILSQSEGVKALASLYDNSCPPMFTMGIVPIGCIFYEVQFKGRNDLGFGFPPGHFTFVGGSGAIIPKYSKHKDVAWKYLTVLINPRDTFVPRLTSEGAVPPLKSFGNYGFFKTPVYQFSKQLMTRGVPVQYPGAPYRNWRGLLEYKPFRLMMVEMLYKNFSAQVVTERACKIIDYLFEKPPRECNALDYSSVISDCLANNTKILSFISSPATPCKPGAFQSPQPIYNIECPFIVPDSTVGLAMAGISTFGTFFSVLYIIGFVWYRNEVAIKAATFEFCLVIFFGSILMFVFVYLQPGAPSHALCIARPWFLVLGFSTFFGGFLVKMMRVNAIFRLGQGGKRLGKEQLSLANMNKQLGIIMLFEVSSLIALSAVGSPGVQERTIDLRGAGSYTQLECKPFHQIPVAILFSINAVMIVYGCFIAWRSRNVPDAYNETRFVMVAILLISFTAFAVIPVTLVLSSAQAIYLLEGLAVNFVTIVSVGIFAVPKLWMAYANITPKRTHFRSTESGLNNHKRRSGNTFEPPSSPPATASARSARTARTAVTLGNTPGAPSNKGKSKFRQELTVDSEDSLIQGETLRSYHYKGPWEGAESSRSNGGSSSMI
ncbi:hypothetical protein HK102_011572 [Quaeritorhiza haematococci]|nr:hypothetical protein HK102_011572 [Quaeritorhiza haematococci]